MVADSLTWLAVHLGDIVPYGKTEKCELSDVTDDTWILELEDIERDSSKILKRLDITERPFKSTKNKFSKGDVLYGKLRPYLNKVVIADKSGVCSTEIIPLNAEPYLDNRYLFYWLKSEEFLGFVNSVSYGVNMPRLGTKDGLLAPFILAPLAEQKVIADKLDTLLAQVESTKARLERIPDILKCFRQSVLTAAVSGKLTEEWCSNDLDYYKELDAEISQEPKLKKLSTLSDEDIHQAKTLFNGTEWPKWRLYPLEQLVEPNRGIPYGIVQTGVPASDGIPTIRCGDVKPLSVDMKDLKLVSRDIESTYSRTRLVGNEVVLAIRGTVGNAAVITEDMVKSPLNISREVAMIPVRSNINPKFVAMLLQSPGGYRCLAEKTKGVAQRGINLADVKRLVTPLPTYEEQTEIVRRVEGLFAFADNIEQKATAALERVNNLTQSILAKAFRGELTADWRAANPELISGENSAEALLAKIQTERTKPVQRKSRRA
ncbi:restriction endonuclease subunit S [Shewanella algae]|uniref:restriction endonuclease subunit S n=1 Tax=Shewanella algae TaxID=38313 RepID=UPI0011856292|nr:restriction endonuclease subunit S [Shewanella algae]TVP06579.1 hypothetical protein AYI73_09855 [Shewanella algae]BCV39099.1 type I restriction-modification system restriction endonuclease DNA specificity subunit HsdS [Shewanella algae]